MSKLFATCSLCKNFDPNRQTCLLSKEEVYSVEHTISSKCVETGVFIRDINVIPESYHYFLEEDVPYGWQQRFPLDEDGVSFFVLTKRGTERVIPVEGCSKSLKGDPLVGVDKVYTYQGQRELIYDLGVDLARAEAEKKGVPLHVLPGEENSVGIKLEIQRHLHVQGSLSNPQTAWLMEDGEVW